MLGLLVLIAAIWIIKGRKKDDGITVAVEKTATRDIIEVVSATGKIYPEIEVKVSSDVSGEITDLLVQEGDSVKKGQVLARIYADVYGSVKEKASAMVSQSQSQLATREATIAAFKARLDQAKIIYDRNKKLLEDKVIAKTEFETADANYQAALSDYNSAMQQVNSDRFAIRSAQADLKEANTNLGRTTISSPMGGIVSMLPVKKGERVVGTAQMAGTEMLRIANMNVMEVQVDVGENDIPKVKYGDTAVIEVDAYNNRKFKGLVTQIASSSKDAASATATSSTEQVTNYIVHIRVLHSSYADLYDPKHPNIYPLRPGMSASVDIQTRYGKGVTSIPITAVTTRDMNDTGKVHAKGGKGTKGPAANVDEGPEKKKDIREVVFVLQPDGTAKMREVTIGIQDDNNIEVRSGLKVGEQVIVAPYAAVSRELENNKKVKVVPKSELFTGPGK
ncbi:efflux RND transporter periplasmic adaptor subunit [Chitinophaga sedimenti]|uniref:efflux RND transporter periplasmic adaptor subunit n=1 Tax=Chitinophaga sedimenti TaxID=2033606 RepID=UPI0020035035|nr:efflux RND transporter periplasmic adaptor subunit [Chitinophaga sedimenti]MCK7558879.1 efflux RND transporter periplasmic adaptor subunit [Chitinophaga sedimenti]